MRIAISALSLCLLALPGMAANNDTTPELPKNVTFSEHVAPVIHENCSGCHRPGDIAPMALRTYDEVRPWAKSIRQAVTDGTMPPWHADAEYGEWANDRRLTDYERELISKWVKQGAPVGDASAVQAVADQGEGYRLGVPDTEITFKEVSLPAEGPDVFMNLLQAWTLDEDRWIQSVEVLPGDRKVVHHVIIYVLKPGQSSPDSWLGAWAAGMDPMTFPEGTGRLIQKGSTLIADMHYHPSGEATIDQTRLGLYFHDAEPEKELVNLWVQNAGFKIPAGAPNHEVRSAYTFLQDSTIHGFLPHMHYRGKDFTYTIRYPDGREETVLKVSGYDFNWQTVYELAQPIDVPAGSKVLCVAHFDNSTANLANPDPTRDVTFGNESFDEMMIGFVDYTVKDGLRPMSPEERLVNTMRDLVAEHPGEVFDVVLDQGDSNFKTGLFFPREGMAKWFIPVNGELWESNLTGLVRDADGAYTAKLVTPFGTFDLTGTGGPDDGVVEGKVDMGGNGIMMYSGKLAGSV